MNWYIEVWKKYAVFSGRARRKECWYFMLFHALIFIVLGAIDGRSNSATMGPTFGAADAYALAAFVPSLAVTIRRLHDTLRSGWWLLISFIPVIGAIVLIAFAVQDSESGDNEYGKHPKKTEAEAA